MGARLLPRSGLLLLPYGIAVGKRPIELGGDVFMKLIAIILALAFAAVAVCYFVVPAGSLPNFFPGFEPQSSHTHVKHGIASLTLAVILLGVAWVSARSTARS
jgi:amino acid permease